MMASLAKTRRWYVRLESFLSILRQRVCAVRVWPGPAAARETDQAYARGHRAEWRAFFRAASPFRSSVTKQAQLIGSHDHRQDSIKTAAGRRRRERVRRNLVRKRKAGRHSSLARTWRGMDSESCAELALLDEVLDPADRILEIAAGAELISLLAVKRRGVNAVLSYEAHPGSDELIRRSFVSKGSQPQFPNHANDAREPALAPEVPSMSLIDQGNGTVGIECEVMDDVIEQFRPNCLVMDVEGAALRLLPRASLQGVSKVILERRRQFIGQPALKALDLYLQLKGFTRAGVLERGTVYLYLRLNA